MYKTVEHSIVTRLKKNALLIILPLLCCLSAMAQPEFENWGQLSAAEKALQVCAFDSEAVAIVLIDEAIADYDDSRRLIMHRRIRIKVLKEQGMEYANVQIPYYAGNDFQQIEDIQAIAYNFDASGHLTTQEVDRKSIFTQQRNALWHYKKFTFPGAKVGSVVEYRYRSIEKNYFNLETWEFQQELPVAKSKFTLTVPPGYEFAYMVFKSQQFPVNIKKESNDGRYLFAMDSIPGLRDEPYMDARKDYLQRVNFQLSAYNNGAFGKQKYMTSWDEVTRELNTAPYFGSQIGKSISGTEAFIAQMKALPSPHEKMKRIYNYTRNYMTWDRFYGIGSSDGIKSAWNKKTGNIAEINMILVTLLQAAGLEAYPMLVSERFHGKVSTQYPFVGQFNATYAAVFIDGQKYYLDATDPYGQPELVPLSILNTSAFIVHRKKGGIVNISDEAMQYRENITISVKIGADNQLTGEGWISSVQYARINRLSAWQRGREKYIDGIRKTGSSITIDSIEIKNEKEDSLPLSQHIQFKGQATTTGDYIFVPVNLFSGFETNPFIASNRFSDINFGYRKNVSFNTYLDIPEGYAPDELPKSLQLVNEDKTVVFIREVFNDANNRKILARFRIEFKKSLYSVDEYGALKEFYKRMFELLNEQIVFKKK